MVRLSLVEINAYDQATFVDRLGALFEGPPWIVAAGWSARPFASRDALYRGLCAAMMAASVERQVALIRAHPDLAGRLARIGRLSAESTREQTAAGLDALTDDEIDRFDQGNRAYRQRFGFPFVLCAREHSRASILANLATRLTNSREREIATALDEVAKICRLRLLDLVADDDQTADAAGLVTADADGLMVKEQPA